MLIGPYLKFELASDYNRLATTQAKVGAGSIEGSDLETIETNSESLERVRRELSR